MVLKAGLKDFYLLLTRFLLLLRKECFHSEKNAFLHGLALIAQSESHDPETVKEPEIPTLSFQLSQKRNARRTGFKTLLENKPIHRVCYM